LEESNYAYCLSYVLAVLFTAAQLFLISAKGCRMNAYELCQRHVVTIRRHEELSTAAWMMRERNVGCLVVVDPVDGTGGWVPVGLISDREIVTNVIARDCDPRNVVIEDVMAPHPLTVLDKTSLEDTLQQLRGAKARRILVVDESGRLAGILAREEILDHLTQRAAHVMSAGRRDLRLVESARL
jgi:predicted transcriptional regulator